MIVDWRNRFGWNWITSVRSQGSAPNCWAFAMTALYEAMVRIEHCVWSRRSEGDLARATGKQPWDLGNLGEASIAAERYGIADPDCFPWSEAAALYTAKPHGAAMSALPLAPTPDRRGRTVRIGVGAHTSLSSVADKKQWLDLVGPMAVMFSVPTDFGTLGANDIYTPSPQSSPSGNWHALIVVGFDDSLGCWTIKNSWGPSWNNGGFLRVAFGATFLEGETWVGMRNTNPDPWSKRRQRNGVLVESGNGAAHQNRELFIRKGVDLEQWWREGGSQANPWNRAGVIASADPWRATFGKDAVDCPAVVQSSFNRNYELIYRTTFGKLRHIYFDQAAGWWTDATLLGPANPLGIPGFVQGTRGAPGDFEVVVLTSSGVLEHWAKHNGSPWTHPVGTWFQRATFGSGIALAGPALVQTRVGLMGELEQERGSLDYVAVSGGVLKHFRWSSGGAWSLIDSFGGGITSAPCMIEGPTGATDELTAGTLELFVATGGAVQHWTRSGGATGSWTQSATFGANAARVVGALQGSLAFALEVVIERTDGLYQHYFRGGAGWQAGPTI
jgi:hypothetical protein